MHQAAHFTASKVESMADETVDLSLHGLPPISKVTLRSEVLMNNKFKFSAHGFHHTDVDGSVFTSVDPSIGGSYSGIDPMGLFWSITPDKTIRKGFRYLPDIFVPAEYKLSAYLGHLDDFESEEKLAEVTIRRQWISDDVDFENVRCGRVRGILFTPKDKSRRYPGVVDIYGSGGGLMPHRAALMASKGFVTLALAFFRYQDLPKSMNRIDLDYFVEAIDYLRSKDCVQPGGIGGIGLSKGADLMVEVAAVTPHLKALAFINGFCHPMFCNIFWQGKLHREPLSVDWSHVRELEDQSIALKDCYVFDALPDSKLLPVERISGKIGFFISLDDANVPALDCASKLIKKMKKHGRERDCQLFTFEGSGHVIEPAYMPYCSSQYQPHMGGYVASYGGTPALHHQAQLRYWPQLINFFRTNLRQDAASGRAKL